jgi:hypothetical protein
MFLAPAIFSLQRFSAALPLFSFWQIAGIREDPSDVRLWGRADIGRAIALVEPSLLTAIYEYR